MEYSECIKRRLLRKDDRNRADPDKVKKSLEIAEERLAEARKSHEHGINTAAIVLSYTSMFHTARALLFNDGFVEKSHACLSAYVKEEYVKKNRLSQKYLRLLKEARFERHETLYGLETKAPDEETKYLLDCAGEFLVEIRKVLRHKNKETHIKIKK